MTPIEAWNAHFPECRACNAGLSAFLKSTGDDPDRKLGRQGVLASRPGKDPDPAYKGLCEEGQKLWLAREKYLAPKK